MKKLILSAFLFFAHAATLFGQTFTFVFNPPNPVSFVERQKIVKIKYENGKKITEDEISLAKAITICKTKRGYSIEEKPISINSKRNGVPFTNPIFMFLSNISTKGTIDSSGRLKSVSGYEGLIRRARRTLPPDVADAMALSVDEDAMIKKAVADWNARVAEFIGQTVKIGDIFTGEGKFPIPNGETLTFFSAVKIADTTRRDGILCVKLKFKNSSVPDSLAAFIGASPSELSKYFDLNANKNLSEPISLDGEGERLVDPKTSLIYYEKSKRTINMASEIMGDEEKKIKTVEIKEFTYEYK